MAINIKRLKSQISTQPKRNETDFILEQGEILYTISESFIKYRKEHSNMTQKELATKLSVNQSMIAKLESGNYNPTFKLIHKLTTKLENSSDMFVNILESMIQNIKRVTNIDYQISIVEDNEYENYYYTKNKNNKKNNVIFLLNYNKKGDKIDERNQCQISVGR